MRTDEEELEETLPVRSFPVPKARERATVSRKARPSSIKATHPRRQSATAFQDELRGLVTGLAQRMDAIEPSPFSHHQASNPPVHFGISTPPTWLRAVAKPGTGTAFDRARDLLRGPKTSYIPMGPPSQHPHLMPM